MPTESGSNMVFSYRANERGNNMAAIQLHSDCPDAMTSVSNYFIDHYMPEANGEFVKVYIYLLRCMASSSKTVSVSAIADLFEHTEKDVVRALKYWEKVGLLKLEYADDASILGIYFLTVRPKTLDAAAPIPAAAVQKEAAPKETSAVSQKSASKAPSKKEYTLDEIKAFQKDEDISELFFIVETYLKHPLNPTDINTILYWHESLHFSTELIVYLVEYCISKGHSSIRYMEKVALGWCSQNITTVEQAKASSAAHSQVYYGVMKALGISGRNLVESETVLITKWTKEFGYDMELIQEACKRTITATHQPSFEYTDSILTSWHKNRVHTLKDVARLDSSYNRNKKAAAASSASVPTSKNKFNNFNQREYDYDQLEKMLLTTSVHE